MAITTNQPVEIQFPEIPFDKLAISLAISPLFEPTRIGASVAMQCIPYRILPDGTVEAKREAARSIAIGDAFVEAQNDPALAVAVQTIYGALGQFVAAKNL